MAHVDLSIAMSSFELIAERVVRVRLGARLEVRRTGLRHPIHQVLRVFGYEVIGWIG